MKKIVTLNIVLLFFLAFISCSKEEIETYSGTDNVYFSNAVYPPNGINAPLIDSTGFSFGMDNPSITQRIFKIPIRVQGKISDIDRKIKVAIDPSSTAIEKTQFSLPQNIVMHAGRVVDTIEVIVFRSPEMKTKSFTLVLNLEENEFFTTRMQDKVINTLTQKTMSFTRYKLSFDDMFGQPKGWFAPYFGIFTAKKFFLMCDLMKLEPTMFNQSLGAPGLSVAEMKYYSQFMFRYLTDQKVSGNTIYEEDGTEMIFPRT